MGKWCLHASSFIFDQVVIKVAGNQDEFDFGPLVSMAHLYVFEMRFDLGTLDSGERSLPFGLLVNSFASILSEIILPFPRPLYDTIFKFARSSVRIANPFDKRVP